MYILYLLYGLTFFTLGVAILSRDISLSELVSPESSGCLPPSGSFMAFTSGWNC